MRIDSGLPPQNTGEVDRMGKKPAQCEGKSPDSVTAELSPDTVRISSLEGQANQVPDIRQEKVDALRSSVQSGEYRVSDAKLADAILRDILRS